MSLNPPSLALGATTSPVSPVSIFQNVYSFIGYHVLGILGASDLNLVSANGSLVLCFLSW